MHTSADNGDVAATDQQILDAIKDAIFQIASGAVDSYSVNGRSFRFADLSKLSELERVYQARVARAAGTSGSRMFAGGTFREAR